MNLSFRERLTNEVKFSFGAERRKLRDITESFKCVKGIIVNGVLNKVFVSEKDVRTRSKGYEFGKYKFEKETGRNWFTSRVVDEWRIDSFKLLSTTTGLPFITT